MVPNRCKSSVIATTDLCAGALSCFCFIPFCKRILFSSHKRASEASVPGPLHLQAEHLTSSRSCSLEMKLWTKCVMFGLFSLFLQRYHTCPTSLQISYHGHTAAGFLLLDTTTIFVLNSEVWDRHKFAMDTNRPYQVFTKIWFCQLRGYTMAVNFCNWGSEFILSLLSIRQKRYNVKQI